MSKLLFRIGLCCLFAGGLMAQRGGGGHAGGGFHGGGGFGGGVRGGGGFGGRGFGGGYGGTGYGRGFTYNRGFSFNRGFDGRFGFGRGTLGFGYGSGLYGWGLGFWGSPYYGYWDDPYAYNYDPYLSMYPTYSAPLEYSPSPNVTVIYPAAPGASQAYSGPAEPVMRTYDGSGQETNAEGAPPPAPMRSGSPIYLIAGKDQIIHAAASYWIVGNTLHYVTLQHEEKQMPLDSVDRALTVQLNRERRVPFQLP